MVNSAVNRLGAKSLDIIMSHCDKATDEPTITTMATLFATLKEAFSNWDPTNTACRKLQSL